MATSNLKDRAVLVKYTDRTWRGGVINREASEELEQNNGAKKGTGHYWQRLVPRAAIKERDNLGRAARLYHNANTLPWLGDGVRILPAANFDEYMRGMRKHKADADAAAKKFCKDFSQWVDEAKRTQGKLFNPDRYPTQAQLEERFGFELTVLPLPNVADWRVDLGEEKVKELIAEAEQKMASVMQDGIAELFERLQEVLKHAHDRLADKEAVFRDSLIGNIKEMTVLLGRLNFANDPRIEELRKMTEEQFAGVEPQALRDDPVARISAASKASAIMRKMEAFMGKGKVQLPPEPVEQPKERKPMARAKSKVNGNAKLLDVQQDINAEVARANERVKAAVDPVQAALIAKRAKKAQAERERRAAIKAAKQ